MEKEVNAEMQLIIDQALEDQYFRVSLVTESFYWFLIIYFPEYLKYPLADFHKEIINITQSDAKNIAIAAFRGSGKSTLISQAYVLWAMTGVKKKRFILLISYSMEQSKGLMKNLKLTLETNSLLKQDLGPFYEQSEEWKSSSLIFRNYDTKIMITSVNESIRGTRYKEIRPDLIILDDVEKLETIRTTDGKEKTLDWFDRDIVPLGDDNTQLVVLGTIMARDALLDTLKHRIDNGDLDGVFRLYSIITDTGKILWNTRWKTLEDLQNFRKSKGIVDLSWNTEYLLKDLSELHQIIKRSDILYYEIMPDKAVGFRNTLISVDPAVSEKSTADFTAIIFMELYGYGKDLKLYVHKNIVNRRMSYTKTKEFLENVFFDLQENGSNPIVVFEQVGAQLGMIHDLQSLGLFVYGSKPGTSDKFSRLYRVSPLITNGQVLFPNTGAEELVTQLTNFGVVKDHDDLVDALSMGITYGLEHTRDKRARIFSNKPKGF
ncbi:hypothetical protein HN803_00795 [candidate division WWE3 bacterium]|jgi:predicted phage terminase large subunit-like protein|nr:hypothetical protein [candidate division WWE3 bacterium]MBT7349319.1 hypothetical protein [candidate division WWE3 bacterium]